MFIFLLCLKAGSEPSTRSRVFVAYCEGCIPLPSSCQPQGQVSKGSCDDGSLSLFSALAGRPRHSAALASTRHVCSRSLCPGAKQTKGHLPGAMGDLGPSLCGNKAPEDLHDLQLQYRRPPCLDEPWHYIFTTRVCVWPPFLMQIEYI